MSSEDMEIIYAVSAGLVIREGFGKKHGKERQDQTRQDGKVSTLRGQEMADPGKTESAIFFSVVNSGFNCVPRVGSPRHGVPDGRQPEE